MGGNTIEPTEQDFRIAFNGLWSQAKANGVVITWEVREFLLHEAEVTACHYAWHRFYQNLIHNE